MLKIVATSDAHPDNSCVRGMCLSFVELKNRYTAEQNFSIVGSTMFQVMILGYAPIKIVLDMKYRFKIVDILKKFVSFDTEASYHIWFSN